VNAPSLYRPTRLELERERHYPFLALLDSLLSWSLGLATLAVSAYAFGRIVLFVYPIVLFWMHALGWS